MLAALLPFLLPVANAQVTVTTGNGATNPAAPGFYSVGSTINQSSLSRLLTLNGVDDFCVYGGPSPGSVIGNVEAEVVAYCTKPRNNARLIPDGAITSAHFVRTPLYVQISGMWDGTKVNIAAGDGGGELDPHGAENLGNPIGGNVTSNVSGQDQFYEEWMSYVSMNEFCLRICTAQTANVTAALECEHEIDLLGCQWVMAIGNYYSSDNSFTACDGDPAYPPGLYPLSNGSTSTFRQRYTGTYTAGTSVGTFTVGQTATPSAPAFFPATSNCVTYNTISNGVNTNNYAVTASPNTLAGPPGAWSSAAYSYKIPYSANAALNATVSTSASASSTSASSSTSLSSNSAASASSTSASGTGSSSASRASSASATASSSSAAGVAIVPFKGTFVVMGSVVVAAAVAGAGLIL